MNLRTTWGSAVCLSDFRRLVSPHPLLLCVLHPEGTSMLHGSSWQVSNKIESNCHSGCDNNSRCRSILPWHAGGWGYCRSVPSPSAHSPLAPAVLTRAAAAVCVCVHVFVCNFKVWSAHIDNGPLLTHHHTCRSLRNYSVK